MLQNYGVWGLNSGKNNKKDRSDDRHHAVDACVIAACSQGTIMKVAKASSLGKEYFKQKKESRLADTQPWETFAEDVLERKKTVIPTRMVSHGVTGRAFEETAYRFDGFNEDPGRLARLYGNKKETTKGNIVIGKDGNARLLDGVAFLRLWLDPEAKKGKGKWYAEPVYYAEIPELRNGTYVPKALKAHVARCNSEPLPESAMKLPPITLFRGDVLEVDGKRARFWKINIANISLTCLSLQTGEETKSLTTLGKWNKDTVVRVIDEDCLGHCYNDYFVDSLED